MGNSASLVSPAYDSFLTLGSGFPTDRVYDW
jgi:hypothetical protein